MFGQFPVYIAISPHTIEMDAFIICSSHLYITPVFITRLVRGDGEILEEIVSEARHKEINRTATSGDGASFQAMLNTKLRS